MREQDMRERVERFIQKHLCSRVLPAAFGLGVGLTGACATPSLSAGNAANPPVTANPDATAASTSSPAAEQDEPPDVVHETPIYSAPVKCSECKRK
jgi:hypothetical protein